MILDACRHALLHNLGVAAGESVLVVTDPLAAAIGEAFHQAARSVTPQVERMEIPAPAYNGEEPPAEAAASMAGADVVVLVTSRSLSWTDARQRATARGARLASLPGIDEEILLRTLTIDYDSVRWRVNRLCDRLDQARTVRVTTAAGTSLEFSIEGRVAHGRKGGIYRERGQWGNLPCGEAFVAPVEGRAHGVYVVDASHAGVGRLHTPIRVTVEGGRATAIEGGEQARALSDTLAAAADPAAYNLAEFGIGCNHAARICGITLEDEKVLGTCHLALGRNDQFGGTVRVGLHLDGVIERPEILLDGQPLGEVD